MKTMRRLRTSWLALVSAAVLLASCAPAQSASPAPAAPQAAAAPAAPAATAAPQPAAPVPTARPSPTPQPTATATPVGTQIKKGGVLKVMSYADPGTLDLLSATSTIVIAPLGLSYDGLVKEDPLKPGQLAPDLAERWDVSGDGRKVTLFLRKGVTFHNGKPFTSADAKVSVERFMTDNEQLAPALRAVVATVEAPDSNTLVLNLKFPYPDLFKGLMMRWDSVVPAEHRTEKDIKEIIGTGPFKFKSYQSGVSWDTVRNEKYWNPGLPHMDGVTVYIIPDRNTGVAAFRAGRVDITAGAYLTVPQFKLIESQMKGQATAYLYPNSYWWNLYMPNNKKPWSDPRVRKAAFMVIDRKQAVQTVDQGLGAADGLLPPGLGGMTQDELKSIPGWREPKSMDIAEAKKLMADAGYPNGFKTDIFYRQGADYESMAVYVRDQLKTLGIESVINTRPGAAFYDYVYARSYGSHTHRHPLAPASPDTILAQYYRSGGSRNFADVSDKKLDGMIDGQMSTLDPQERKKQLRDIQMYLYDNALASIISWGNYSQAWQKWVRDYNPGQTNYNNTRYEVVWLNK